MRVLVLTIAMLLSGWSYAAENYPSQRITVIAPFAPGSGTDAVARIVSQRLSEILKTTIIVDNRVGANGALGAAAAARSAPDGYTLFAGGTSTHAANPSLSEIDPVRSRRRFRSDFAVRPVSLFPDRRSQPARQKRRRPRGAGQEQAGHVDVRLCQRAWPIVRRGVQAAGRDRYRRRALPKQPAGRDRHYCATCLDDVYRTWHLRSPRSRPAWYARSQPQIRTAPRYSLTFRP